MKNKLGVVLIGQSPRPDCEAFFKGCLLEGDEIVIKGALDDLSAKELQKLRPQKGEGVLAALDRDLSPVVIPEKEVKERLPQKVKEVEQEGANIIVIYCSGQFPELTSSVPLILPGEILTHNVAAIARGRKVAVLVPEKNQIQRTREKLLSINVESYVEAASPFGPKDVIWQTCKNLALFDPAFIVMDCTSYDDEMKEKARTVSGKPVITANSILAKVVSELAGK